MKVLETKWVQAGYGPKSGEPRITPIVQSTTYHWVRRDDSAPNSLHIWVVADNIRKGAATNAVQILELLL